MSETPVMVTGNTAFIHRKERSQLFTVLAWGGVEPLSSDHRILNVYDCDEDLKEILYEDYRNSDLLEDIGWKGERFSGLMLLLMEFVAEGGPAAEDWCTEWVEIERQRPSTVMLRALTEIECD